MDLFSFTTIIIVLFIIIGSYLLLTTEIEGRAKTVLLVSVIVAFIIIFINLPIFKSFSEGVKSPKSSLFPTTISKYEVTSSYSVSMWIYISDWNDSLGKKKIICIRKIGSATDYKPSPNIYLDEYNNKLNVSFYTIAQNNAAKPVLTNVVIDNIGIQKWVNIVVCLGDNKVDTYINGKLEKTTVTPNPQYNNLTLKSSDQPFTFTPSSDDISGSYTGFISNTRYYPKFLRPAFSCGVILFAESTKKAKYGFTGSPVSSLT
jgi:hypothetical protein